MLWLGMGWLFLCGLRQYKPGTPTTTERVDRADAGKIQGCDYHPGFQQIAFVDTKLGSCKSANLGIVSKSVRVGMEASGQARWFELPAGGTGVRVVDQGCGKDSKQTRTEKTDRQDFQQWKTSVRTAASPEQALVCSRTPRSQIVIPFETRPFEMALFIQPEEYHWATELVVGEISITLVNPKVPCVLCTDGGQSKSKPRIS